ncbi:diguanylate cyclase domain-containing protein [Streptomyces sp. NPDC090231]|uniref:diguanylate cyclase domain-containing protein n=1 Tax=unclassified Streptomyces TaxID=2593676 RepID=UPI003827A2D5
MAVTWQEPATTVAWPEPTRFRLDDSKNLDDTHGHAAGDVALAVNAARLAAWYGRHGIAGRRGEDEFVAIAHQTPDLDSLHRADLEWWQEAASGWSTWGAPSARRPRRSLLVWTWCATPELVRTPKKPRPWSEASRVLLWSG